MAGTPHPQRRTRPLVVARADHRADRRRRRGRDVVDPIEEAAGLARPGRGFVQQPACSPGLATSEVRHHPDRRLEHALTEIATELAWFVLVDRLLDDALEVDVVGWQLLWLGAFVRLRHPQLTDPIGDDVVQDRPHRRAASFDPVDHHVAPHRPGAIERFEVQLGRQVEQLALRSRFGETNVANVEVEVEFAVRHPHRGREAADRRDDPLAQTRQLRHRDPHRLPEVIEVDRPIEDIEGRTTRIQPWVLLDVPHQRLAVGHPMLEPLLALHLLPCRAHSRRVGALVDLAPCSAGRPGSDGPIPPTGSPTDPGSP